ncbi:lysozyme [Erythrobacter sp.]|uniref:lysozyme n=1 Tax=Erythrobacter sp. TaxID=1042 RepID=UPI001425F55A|nr:lysozyme [Erythrobacter sp.]QIQ86844.1 MAG: lysozyme [Erythrobacter sp.]
MTGFDRRSCPPRSFIETLRAIIGSTSRPAGDKDLDEVPVPDIDLAPVPERTPAPAPASVAVASVPRVARRAPVHRIGPEGIALIKRFEGCARLRPDGLVEAYPDPCSGGDPWTIGWGSTGAEIGPGTVWTQAECDARFEADLARYAAEVAAAIGDAPTTQAQFDALVSFHYNTGAIARATLTRRHRACDHAGAAREFPRWNKAAGRVVRGLVRRRAAEAALYLS